MPQTDKDDARLHSKNYYKRLKSDPSKWAAYIQQKVEKQRERRAREKRLRNQPEESALSPSKTSPLPEESSPEESPPPAKRTEESPVVTPRIPPGCSDLRHLGGKHAPPTAGGGIGLTPDGIVEEWHKTWSMTDRKPTEKPTEPTTEMQEHGQKLTKEPTEAPTDELTEFFENFCPGEPDDLF